MVSFTQGSSYLYDDGTESFGKRNQVWSHPTIGPDAPTYWLFEFDQGKNDLFGIQKWGRSTKQI